MIPYWMSRTELMLGQENVNALMGKNVLIIGLGGVGGICAEMIARAGVGKMTIVDNDTIDLSNINRQIPALHSTAGQSKAQVLGARLKDITPALDLSKAKRVQNAPKRVNVDFPVWMVESLDREASKLGVTRQSVIKVWLAERLAMNSNGQR